jgi:hypothetical protein
MAKISALIVVIIIAFGFYYLGNFKDINNQSNTENKTQPKEEVVENINDFEECIAAGNPPLPDAPDKCLTKGGHLFIEGVYEE